ncbi:hypothetical protein [Streptomyces sp. DHE17-7]|uniref:hypothetical protein n=1 Tax=Streptomyces sp. DHE17-7 TaxID=2759949 RepID=UPI003FA68CED
MEVPDAALWWPRGYGDQPLYDLELELTEEAAGPGAEERPLDSWHRRIGFRTVELDRSADEPAHGFTSSSRRTIFARRVTGPSDESSSDHPDRYRTRACGAAERG